MLDPEFRDEWANALESGNYTQGKGRLRRNRVDGVMEYCCLGVACDIKNPDGWEDENGEQHRYRYKQTDTIHYCLFPPNSLIYDIGLKHNDVQTLSYMNDIGCSFKEIAEYIRTL